MVAPGDRSPHRVALTLPGASELTFAMEGADGTLWLAARSHVCRAPAADVLAGTVASWACEEIVGAGHSADVSIERDGRNVWTNAVGDGDSIGELGVLTQRRRAASVIVSRDGSRLISIDGDDLMSVLNRNARASMSFLKLLSARQQGMLAKISGA